MKSDLAPVAFRLLTSGLPVRTHLKKEPEARPEGAAGHLSPGQIQRMRDLDGKMRRRDICTLMRISYVTLRRYLGCSKVNPSRK